MRTLFAFATFALTAIPAFAQFPFVLPDFGHGPVAVGTDGSVYATGTFDGTRDIDPGPGEVLLSSEDRDLFVARFSADGQLLYGLATEAEVGAETLSRAVAAAANGDGVVVGRLVGTADFDPSPAAHVLASPTTGAFLARYSAGGDLVYAALLGSGGDEVNARDVVIDAAERIFVAGTFEGTVDFDPGPGEALATSASPHDAYLVRYAPDGTFQALMHIENVGGSGVTFAQLRLLADGGLAVRGRFGSGAIDLDPGPEAAVLTDGARFIASYDPDFSYRTVFEVPAPVNSFAVDGDDAYYLTGSIGEDTDFDVGPGEHIVEAVWSDAFVAKYTENLDLVYAFGLSGDEFLLARTHDGIDIEIGPDGEAFVSGYFTGHTDFDPGPGEHVLNGQFASYFARYSEAGALDWVFSLQTYSGTAANFPYLALTPHGTFIASGVHQHIEDFDPGPGEIILDGGFYSFYLAEYAQDGRITVAHEPDAAPGRSRTRVAPNPFMAEAVVSVTPATTGRVRAEVFDVLGRRLGVLFDGESQAGRAVHIPLDGARLAPGRYLVRIVTPDGVEAHTITKAR